jgi:hypothetical protein
MMTQNKRAREKMARLSRFYSDVEMLSMYFCSLSS